MSDFSSIGMPAIDVVLDRFEGTAAPRKLAVVRAWLVVRPDEPVPQASRKRGGLLRLLRGGR